MLEEILCKSFKRANNNNNNFYYFTDREFPYND